MLDRLPTPAERAVFDDIARRHAAMKRRLARRSVARAITAIVVALIGVTVVYLGLLGAIALFAVITDR